MLALQIDDDDDDDDYDDVTNQMDPVRGERRGRWWKVVQAARCDAVTPCFVRTSSRTECRYRHAGRWGRQHRPGRRCVQQLVFSI